MKHFHTCPICDKSQIECNNTLYLDPSILCHTLKYISRYCADCRKKKSPTKKVKRRRRRRTG